MTIDRLSHKNFQAYDFNTTNKILKKNFVSNKKFEQNDDKTVVFCIGVNGSGKSTYLANLYQKSNFNLPYLNADILSQILPEKEKLLASKKTTEIASKLIDEGKSFCFESVFTHPSKIELLKKAKQKGYNVVGIYVSVEDCEINKSRVKARVEQGGHNVPPEKIEERFNKMKEVVCGLIEHCNELIFFDNSTKLNLITNNKKNEKEGREFCQE